MVVNKLETNNQISRLVKAALAVVALIIASHMEGLMAVSADAPWPEDNLLPNRA
jgi:hypothetical protein